MQEAFPPTDPVSDEADTFEKGFDAKAYLHTYYPPLEIESALGLLEKLGKEGSSLADIGDIKSSCENSAEKAENLLILEWNRKVATALLEAFPADHATVLDVGGGPTMYQHLPTSFVARTTVHLELLESNRSAAMEAIRRAHRQSETGYDWSSYYKVMQQMFQRDPEFQKLLGTLVESDNPNIAAHARRVADFVGAPYERFEAKLHLRPFFLVPGDVFREDLGIGKWTLEKYREGFDFDIASIDKTGMVELVTAHFIAESATGSEAKWHAGMRNIMARVKPGGFLSVAAIRNAEWYKVGEEKMPAVPVDEPELRAVLVENGFTIIEEQIVNGSDKEKDGYDGMVFFLAKKDVAGGSSPRLPD